MLDLVGDPLRGRAAVGNLADMDRTQAGDPLRHGDGHDGPQCLVRQQVEEEFKGVHLDPGPLSLADGLVMPDLIVGLPAHKDFFLGIQVIRVDSVLLGRHPRGLQDVHLLPHDGFCHDIFKVEMVVHKADVDLMVLQEPIELIGVVRFNMKVHHMVLLF